MIASSDRVWVSSGNVRGWFGTRERSVVGAPSLNLFIEALALAHRRRDLQPLAQRTFERLDAESGRAWAEHRARRGCSADHGSKVRFARDSPLEGEGFEPSVPREGNYATRLPPDRGRPARRTSHQKTVGSKGDPI